MTATAAAAVLAPGLAPSRAAAQATRLAPSPAAAQVTRLAPSRAAAQATRLAPSPAAAKATQFTAPVAERFVAGPARAGVAPWGLAYNPTTDELVVGDYLANRLRRYSLDGEHVGDFTDPAGNAEGVASGVAIDPRDGAVYVAVTGDGRTSQDIRKYRADGTFLFDFDVPGGATWVAVRPDGVLVVPVAFNGRVRLVTVDDATGTATAGPHFGPQAGRLTGVDVAADGTMYIAEPSSGVVRVYSPAGQQVRTIGSRAQFPGDMRGVLLDEAAGRLYVADAQTGEIDAFGLDGSHVGQIGGLGTGPGQFADGARQLAQLPDGTLLAADYGNRRVQHFTTDGALLGAFPHPGQDAAVTGVVEPRGVAVDPATGDIVVADPWAQRVQRFAPDGRLLAVHGIRGSFPPDGMNYPRSVAIDPATGDVWVPNYEGDPDLVVYDRDFGFVRQIDTPRFVGDIEIVGDLAYLLVRRPAEVRVHDVETGALVRSFPVAGLLVRGLGVDPATGEAWVTSDADRNLHIYGPTGDRRRTLLVDNRGWGVAVAGDVVYVADAAASRIIVFDRVSGARLGVIGTAGNALGQLGGPSGLTVGPDGRLVVVEQRNARVQVFGPGPVPAPDGLAPAVTWTGPANGSTSAAWPVTITGRATDPTGVAQVQVAVRNVATGQLWDGTNTRWGPWVWNQAVATGAVEDAAWSFTLMPAVPGTTYQFTVRAIDRRGAVSASLTRTFTFADVGAPTVAITAPAAGTSLPRGASVVSGTVADDIGPTAVAVAVEDQAAGRWWDPATGTWGTQAAFTPAEAPDTPGALAPRQVGAWRWPVDTSSWAAASVVVHARATDAAGRSTTATASLGVATADTTPPDTAITSPAVWSNPVGVPLAGTASDNLAVASVGVAVQNLDTLQWWDQATGTWIPSLRWNPATVTGAGGPNATWSYPLALPAGRWHVQARATDAAGLADPTTARYSFRVG